MGEDGDVRSIRPIVPRELERMDEQDDNQITGQGAGAAGAAGGRTTATAGGGGGG